MSSYRRGLAAIANKQICGVDFSKQPNNEVWYITTNGEKYEISENNFIGQYGKQKGLQVVSHTYENGIGKIRYNVDVNRFGESIFSRKLNLFLVSFPRSVNTISAFPFRKGVPYLVLLHNKEVSYNISFKPYILKGLYVQPNCAQYYNRIYTGINIIEKKI